MSGNDFIRDFYGLCVRHGIEFAAVCARDYQGVPIIYHNSWSPGVDEIGKRVQAANMHFDLVGLAEEIRRAAWGPQQE